MKAASLCRRSACLSVSGKERVGSARGAQLVKIDTLTLDVTLAFTGISYRAIAHRFCFSEFRFPTTPPPLSCVAGIGLCLCDSSTEGSLSQM